MRIFLAWLVVIPVAISNPHSDHHTVENSQTGQGSNALHKIHIVGSDGIVPSIKPKEAPFESKATVKRDDPLQGTQSYKAYVTDDKNDSQVNQTRDWLEELVKDKSQMIELKGFPWNDPADVPDDDLQRFYDEGRWDEEMDKLEKTRGWMGLILDAAGYEIVAKKKEWIESIDAESRWKLVEMSPIPFHELNAPTTLRSRDVKWGDWDKQKDAGKDLVQASAFRGSKFDDLNKYVYEKKAGQGVLVYVIDVGVQVDVKNEKGERVFSGFDDMNDRFTILETRAFRDQSTPHNKRHDHSSHGHGTKVVSKIVGQWGTAKGATLVPVQIHPTQAGDTAQAFNVVWRDLRRLKGKTRNPNLPAVVVMSVSTVLEDSSGDHGITREEAEKDALGKEYKYHMDLLLKEGVPIVLASGNYGDQDKRDAIDTIPAVLEGDDFPVINAGAATLEGKPWPKSQGQGTQDGTQLTIYAVGVDVEVHDHNDGKEIRDSGTSFAAPAVGGIIAVHMNYQPWDRSKTGLDKVREIKKFIRSPESSWERIENTNPNKPEVKVNMIWTGADEAAHKLVHETFSNRPIPSPSPKDENEGRTLVVGLEQVGFPRCVTYTPSGINTFPTTVCDSQHDYKYRYFFYRLEHIEEVDSLCTSTLDDFWQDKLGGISDAKLLDKPSWPTGDWDLEMFNEQFTYKNDGRSPGALWKGDRKINCGGDIKQHDFKSDEWCENTLTKSSGASRKRRRLLACKW